MPTGGIVRVWHRERGWGVIDSHDTPGGCWAHFSSVTVPGHRELRAGQEVLFDHEPAAQDGFAFRATEVWPAGEEPHRGEGGTPGASGAYESTLTITFDRPDDPGRADPPGRSPLGGARRGPRQR